MFKDIQETYFNGYRDVLNPVYKDPAGIIFEHAETNRRKTYNEPLIDSSKINKMDVEARKCLMKDQSDWKNIKRKLQMYNRSPLRVSENNILKIVIKNQLF